MFARQRVKGRLPSRASRVVQRETKSAQVLFGGSFLRSGFSQAAIYTLTAQARRRAQANAREGMGLPIPSLKRARE
jgi:hypothetical protein